MNSKLKNTLKAVYGSETPDRRTDFINELVLDPRWQRIHPISSFFRLHPIAMPAGAVTAAAALCLCILFFALGGGKMPQPDIPPVVISEVTVTTSQLTGSTTARDTVTTAAERITAPAEKPANTAPTENTTAAVRTARIPINTAKNDIAINNSGKNGTVRTGVGTSRLVTSTATVRATTAIPVTTTVMANDSFSHSYGAEDIWFDDGSANFDLFFSYTDRDILKEQNAKEFSQMKYLDLASMHAELTCEGTIVDVEYTSYMGVPYTIVSVGVDRVYDTYRDDVVNRGNVIRILEPGGYISVAEHLVANPDDRRFEGWSEEKKTATMLYDPISNREVQKIGDSNLYFLTKKHMSKYMGVINYPVEDDMYVRSVINDICQFRVEGNEYRLVNRDIDVSCTFDEIVETFPDMAVIEDMNSNRTLIIENDGFFYTGAVVFYAYTNDREKIYLGMIEDFDEYSYLVYEYEECMVKWTKTGVEFTYCDRNNGFEVVTEYFEIP